MRGVLYLAEIQIESIPILFVLLEGEIALRLKRYTDCVE